MRDRQRRHQIVLAVLGVAIAGCTIAATAVSVPPASAQPVDPGPWGNFYDPPAPLPLGSNGDVIRTQPSQLAVSVPMSGGAFPANATRVMYRSEDTHGAPTAITGTYLDPILPWRGSGPRPLVVLAGGTHGEGRQCAPSMLLNSLIQYHPPFDLMVEYELPAMDLLLSQGIAVMFTDYAGLGTPGPHPYLNRLASAHAVLDAARAAQRLPGTAIGPHTPVGFWGYSEGGGASASAVELQPTYAPELDVKGAYAGAPPADLAATLQQADGGLFIGALGYGLNGFAASYPEIRPVFDRYLNARGRQVMAATATQCDLETMQYAFQRTSDWTTTGQPIWQILQQDPIARAIVDKQRIGTLTPKAPVLVASSINDDLVSNGEVRQLAADWCAKGATVRYDRIDFPPLLPGTVLGHGLPLITELPAANSWMMDRFNGVSAPSSCGALPR